jgi:hypothetical protein
MAGPDCSPTSPSPTHADEAVLRSGLLALLTTDLAAAATDLITRYAARWSIEQAFADARNVLGTGPHRNQSSAGRSTLRLMNVRPHKQSPSERSRFPRTDPI